MRVQTPVLMKHPGQASVNEAFFHLIVSGAGGQQVFPSIKELRQRVREGTATLRRSLVLRGTGYPSSSILRRWITKDRENKVTE